MPSDHPTTASSAYAEPEAQLDVTELLVRCLVFGCWSSFAFQTFIGLFYALQFGERFLPFWSYGLLFDLGLLYSVVAVSVQPRVGRLLTARGLGALNVLAWITASVAFYVMVTLSVTLWERYGILRADLGLILLLVPAQLAGLLRLSLAGGAGRSRQFRTWLWVTRGAVTVLNVTFLSEFIQPLLGKPAMSPVDMARLSVGATLAIVLLQIGLLALRRQPAVEQLAARFIRRK